VFDFNYLCRSEQIFISCKEYKYPMKYIFKCILKWNCLPRFCAFWRFCSQQLRVLKNERVSWSILLFYSQKAISISLMSIFPKLFVIFPTNLVNAEVIALCGLFRIRNKSAFHSFSPIVAAMKIAFIPRKTARKLAHQFNLDLFSLININRFFFYQNSRQMPYFTQHLHCVQRNSMQISTLTFLSYWLFYSYTLKLFLIYTWYKII